MSQNNKLPKIDKGVPIPLGKGDANDIRQLIESMEISDSIFLPGRRAGFIHYLLVRAKSKGHKFTARSITEDGVEGCRVWRTE